MNTAERLLFTRYKRQQIKLRKKALLPIERPPEKVKFAVKWTNRYCAMQNGRSKVDKQKMYRAGWANRHCSPNTHGRISSYTNRHCSLPGDPIEVIFAKCAQIENYKFS